MKRTVRRSVFESNSSSMHSISIIGGDRMNKFLPVSDDGKVHIQYGEFGWGYNVLKTPSQKTSYLITDQRESHDLIKQAVKDYAGLELVIEEKPSNFYPEGYVDHQSSGTSSKYCRDVETIKDFIFNDKYTIIIDNDNH